MFFFGNYSLWKFSGTGQNPDGASFHKQEKARRGGGAWLGFNVADCVPMKKRNSFFCVNFQFCCCLCAHPLCPILLPSLTAPAPLSFFFFSLLLSSGCLDYVAKEIFFLSFLLFFTVSHWFGVNAFWMPLGVCRALGEGGVRRVLPSRGI